MRVVAGRVLVPAAIAAVLSACATYQPAPLQPEQSAAQFIARRLDAPELAGKAAALSGTTVAAWPPATWNRAQLLAVALVLNPRLAVARAQVGVALAREIGAAQTPNPQLTLQSEYARHDPHPWLYGISIDLLLRSTTRKQLDADLARLETAAARWELMDQAWAVRRALTAALADRESARRRSAVLDRTVVAAAQRADLERRRVAAGEDAADELLAASQARIEAEQLQAQARADSIAADAALAAALGVVADAVADIAIDWPDWGAPAPVAADLLDGAREQALRTRADLGAAIDAYAAAENRLHQAVVRQYPQLHLSPGYYWDHGIGKFPFNLAFDAPLFNRNEGEIAEARASRDVAGQRMLAVQAEIIGAIDAAARNEQVFADSVNVAERSRSAALEQRRRSAAGLRLGAIGAGEDLAAEIVASRAELETVALRAQLQAARDTLEDALHAPLSGPELQLAQPLPAAMAGADR